MLLRDLPHITLGRYRDDTGLDLTVVAVAKDPFSGKSSVVYHRTLTPRDMLLAPAGDMYRWTFVGASDVITDFLGHPSAQRSVVAA